MRRILLGLFLSFWLSSLGLAANIGPVLQLTSNKGNEQNPIVVALPDKGYWFVAWEQWSQDGLESDIYGAFVKMKVNEEISSEEDCQFPAIWYRGKCYEGVEVCAGPFAITNESGYTKQYRPSAAYDPDHSIILVLWQDDEWPYLKYRAIETPSTCGEPEKHNIQAVPFNPTFDCSVCQGTCTCIQRVDYHQLCEMTQNQWNPCNNSCYTSSVVEDNVNACTNNGGTYCAVNKTCYFTPQEEQNLCNTASGNYNGEFWLFQWENNSCFRIANIFYTSNDFCHDEFYFNHDDSFSYPEISCNTTQICQDFCRQRFPGSEFDANSSNIFVEHLQPDRLLARKFAQVVYNPHDHSFWLAWIEKREILQTGSANLIREGGCGFTGDLITGEGSLISYAKLDLNRTSINWNDLSDNWEEISSFSTQDDFAKMARLISRGNNDNAPSCSFVPICSVSYEYELFVNTGKLTLTPNITEGGVLIAWSGTRELAYMTFCLSSDGKTEFLTSSKIDPQEKRIWGIHSSEVKIIGSPSKNISETGPAYHPSIEFDPVTSRYLVVWEDARDTGSNTPKIYGQLLDGLSLGLYQANFPLTLREWVGEDLWPTLKQTIPDIEWDPVNQRFFVVWQDNRAGAISIENIDIYGQHVDPEGSLRGQNMLVSATENGQPTAGNQLSPSIAYDPATGIYLAVWKDARHYTQTGSNIYIQAFSVGQSQITILDDEKKPLHPTVIDFGVLRVGERVSKSFYLLNTGDAPLSFCELSHLKEPFHYLLVDQQLVDEDENTCLELQPGMETEVMLEFAPTETGAFSDTIKLVSNAGEHTILVQGMVRPVVTIDKTNFDFNEVLVGNTLSLSFTLVNHLEEDITLGSLKAPQAPFSLEGIGTGTIIPAGGSVMGHLVFSPTESGSFEDTVVLTFSRGGSITLNLTGIGKESPLVFSPGRLDFGFIKVGKYKEASFCITNQSSETVTLLQIEAPQSPYLLEDLSLPLEILPGGTVEISVVFSPGESGLYEGKIGLIFEFPSQGRVNMDYYLTGQALALPACILSTIPKKVMLKKGEYPLWFTLITGDEDLILSRLQEPTLLGFEPLVREEGVYLFAFYPPQDLTPYTYRDRVSFLFAGAKNIVASQTMLVLETPIGWEKCIPQLNLALNGRRSVFLSRNNLPNYLKINIGLSWPCAPKHIRSGQALLKVIAPNGDTYYFDLEKGFVPWLKAYQVNYPINFSHNMSVLVPQNLSSGLWLFELVLKTKENQFYSQAALILGDELLLKNACQTLGGSLLDLQE